MKYGRRRDTLDNRDALYVHKHGVELGALPPVSIDLRSQLPPVWDQEFQDCGPTSMDAFLCYCFPDQWPPGFSRLQIYYDVRTLELDPNSDDGVETRDLFKVLLQTGALREDVWPYDSSTFADHPPAEGTFWKIASYSRLTGPADFLACLAAGRPFIMGFDVRADFEGDEAAKTGIIRRLGSQTIIGGHDVLVVGYDQNFGNSTDLKKSGIPFSAVDGTALLCRNSWGTDWGIDGHFWMPISYPDDSTDCWTAVPAPAPEIPSAIPVREDFP
jgi:hypothetical protein